MFQFDIVLYFIVTYPMAFGILIRSVPWYDGPSRLPCVSVSVTCRWGRISQSPRTCTRTVLHTLGSHSMHFDYCSPPRPNLFGQGCKVITPFPQNIYIQAFGQPIPFLCCKCTLSLFCAGNQKSFDLWCCWIRLYLYSTLLLHYYTHIVCLLLYVIPRWLIVVYVAHTLTRPLAALPSITTSFISSNPLIVVYYIAIPPSSICSYCHRLRY